MTTKRTQRYISLALTAALTSTYTRVRIGAVIVDGNYVVAKAANLCTSHPRQYHYNNKANRLAPAHACHAEIHALVRSKAYDLTSSEIFVARMDRAGRLAMCRPCRACLLAIQEAGIRTITYTTSKGVRSEVT